MSMQRLTQWGGSYHFSSNDDDIENGNFYGFTVQEDGTIVSVLTGSFEGGEIDFLTDEKYSVNISGKQLKAGALVCVDIGGVIKNVSLNTGSIMLHKSS